jgi:hypothetical protein
MTPVIAQLIRAFRHSNVPSKLIAQSREIQDFGNFVPLWLLSRHVKGGNSHLVQIIQHGSNTNFSGPENALNLVV